MSNYKVLEYNKSLEYNRNLLKVEYHHMLTLSEKIEEKIWQGLEYSKRCSGYIRIIKMVLSTWTDLFSSRSQWVAAVLSADTQEQLGQTPKRSDHEDLTGALERQAHLLHKKELN